jgi:hypothetical protein
MKPTLTEAKTWVFAPLSPEGSESCSQESRVRVISSFNKSNEFHVAARRFACTSICTC